MTKRNDHGGGGLTGVTGDLTPDTTDEAFVPGELREIEDPGSHADVTSARGSAAPAQHGEVGNPGWGTDEGDSTDAPRDAGYGSEHGLSPDDPAYRMETHPSRSHEPRDPARGAMTPGGDEVSHSEERF